jgi:hypothetical protein
LFRHWTFLHSNIPSSSQGRWLCYSKVVFTRMKSVTRVVGAANW